MRRRQSTLNSSSFDDDSDKSDIDCCLDIEDEQEETNANIERTDVDSDVEGGKDDKEDLPDLEWIAGEDNTTYPPEYYLDQENNSDESEDEDEDYSDVLASPMHLLLSQTAYHVESIPIFKPRLATGVIPRAVPFSLAFKCLPVDPLRHGSVGVTSCEPHDCQLPLEMRHHDLFGQRDGGFLTL